MATTQPKLDEIRLAVAATNTLFNTEVVGKRNLQALDQVYTADARILPPGAPMICGREAIRNFWGGLVEATGAQSCQLTSVDVIPSGDGAVEIGAAVIVTGDGSRLECKYVVYWRQEDARWKWHVDIWNLNA